MFFIPSSLRCHLVQALILLINRKGEDEERAKRALVVLCDLHRRKVWFDDRTANAICTACFHSSSRILISSLSFLLGYERFEEEDDSDQSSSEDDTTNQKAQVVLNREAVYKISATLFRHHERTAPSPHVQACGRAYPPTPVTAGNHPASACGTYSVLRSLWEAVCSIEIWSRH